MHFTTRLSLFLLLCWYGVLAAMFQNTSTQFSQWITTTPGMMAVVYVPFLVWLVLRGLAFVFTGR